jgi:ABC-type multidrug transport system permease subunit
MKMLRWAGVGLAALAVALLFLSFALSMLGYMPPGFDEPGRPDYMVRSLLWAIVFGLAGVTLIVNTDEN